MEIIWNSHHSFTITSSNGTVAINPGSEDTKAQVVIHSNASSNVEAPRDAASSKYDVSWPGEYETNNTLIVGVEAPHSSKDTLETMYSITFPEGITVGFIGAVAKRPESKAIEKLGNIDILLLSIDENSEVKAPDMVGMIEQVECRIVIPFYTKEESLASFAKALAEALPEAQKSLKIQKSQIASEGTTYTVLQAS